jgi:hypothetical protein
MGGIGAGGSFRVFGEDDAARFCSIYGNEPFLSNSL